MSVWSAQVTCAVRGVRRGRRVRTCGLVGIREKRESTEKREDEYEREAMLRVLKQMMKIGLAALPGLLGCDCACGQQAPQGVKVASLHPLLSEMARRIGGEEVQVVDLFPRNGDLHEFAPDGEAVAAAADSRLVLACGKGVEPYLDSLREALGPQVLLLELGAHVPDVVLPGTRVPDPHWWNCPENMKRASLALADALSALLPTHGADIAARRLTYAQEMDRLTRTAALQLSRLPEQRRTLVTSHAAMCHFCAAFRLRPIAAQGVAREGGGDTAHVAQLLRELRESGVRCLFADLREAPQFLENLAAAVGARVDRLCMDGVAPGVTGYEDVFLHNVRTICRGLQEDAPPPEPPSPNASMP